MALLRRLPAPPRQRYGQCDGVERDAGARRARQVVRRLLRLQHGSLDVRLGLHTQRGAPRRGRYRRKLHGRAQARRVCAACAPRNYQSGLGRSKLTTLGGQRDRLPRRSHAARVISATAGSNAARGRASAYVALMMRRVVLLLCLCAAALLLPWRAESDTPRPRRALTWVARSFYSPWPYAKALDCLASGLQAFPLELAQCLAFSSV